MKHFHDNYPYRKCALLAKVAQDKSPERTSPTEVTCHGIKLAPCPNCKNQSGLTLYETADYNVAIGCPVCGLLAPASLDIETVAHNWNRLYMMDKAWYNIFYREKYESNYDPMRDENDREINAAFTRGRTKQLPFKK